MSEGGSALRCAGDPASPDELRESMARAEDAMSYMEFGQATAFLVAAGQQLACLDQAVDGDLAARLFFLEGVVAQRAGSDGVARTAFQRARLFDPQLSPLARLRPLGVRLGAGRRPGSAGGVVGSRDGLGCRGPRATSMETV